MMNMERPPDMGNSREPLPVNLDYVEWYCERLVDVPDESIFLQGKGGTYTQEEIDRDKELVGRKGREFSSKNHSSIPSGAGAGFTGHERIARTMETAVSAVGEDLFGPEFNLRKTLPYDDYFAHADLFMHCKDERGDIRVLGVDLTKSEPSVSEKVRRMTASARQGVDGFQKIKYFYYDSSSSGRKKEQVPVVIAAFDTRSMTEFLRAFHPEVVGHPGDGNSGWENDKNKKSLRAVIDQLEMLPFRLQFLDEIIDQVSLSEAIAKKHNHSDEEDIFRFWKNLFIETRARIERELGGERMKVLRRSIETDSAYNALRLATHQARMELDNV